MMAGQKHQGENLNDQPDSPTWPPPPHAPNPLAEYEAFLTAQVLSTPAKPPLSRLRLVRDLRRETGLDLRQCLPVVSGYCDRHDIFPLRRGLRLWLVLLPPLAQIALVVIMLVSQIMFERKLNVAPTRLARQILLGERLEWDGVFLCLLLLTLVTSIVSVLISTRRSRREAEDARRKLSA